MAKTKTKTKTKPKSKPSVKAKANGKHAAPKPTPTKIAPPSGDRVELSMLASRPHLPDRMRDAFRGQCTDARAEQLGTETKSGGVLAEARKWCVVIEHTLTHLRPGQLVRYSSDRLTWLLECVADLADTMASEGGRASAAGAATGNLAIAEQRARATRIDIALALEEIADGNGQLEDDLGKSRGKTDTAANLLASLRSLVDLGTSWATSFDPHTHALTESVGLTRDQLTSALAAADALAGAIGGKTTTTARTGKDSAAVNRIEGRVLFEMGKAMAPINEAAARGVGEKLTPGAATARVLAGPKRAAKASPASAPAASA